MKDFFYHIIIGAIFLTHNISATLIFEVENKDNNTTIITGKNENEYIGQAICKKFLPDFKHRGVIISLTFADKYTENGEVQKLFADKARSQMKLEGYSFPLIHKKTI